MPDTRKHRGPHPADVDLFAAGVVPVLREAVADYSWLLTRGYAEASALKLVGDRFQLAERQRIAVRRASCSGQSLTYRLERRVELADLSGATLDIDGFNLLTTIEAALAGGVILVGRDGCHRDMASMHGNYRKVAETRPALVLIGNVLEELRVGECRWYFDSPVSNSGRICALVRDVAAEHRRAWESLLVINPDVVLTGSERTVVTADAGILDAGPRWFDLARAVIERKVPDAWRLFLASIRHVAGR